MSGVAGLAGRKTDLTDEMFGKIKRSILDGNDLKTTANVCEIEINTLYCWTADNYLNLSDKIEGWRRDRKVNLASKNIEDILEMSITNTVLSKDGEDTFEIDDVGKLRVKADISKFVLEALDKPYKPKSDLTSGDKPISILNNVISGNDSNKENIETKEEA